MLITGLLWHGTLGNADTIPKAATAMASTSRFIGRCLGALAGLLVFGQTVPAQVVINEIHYDPPDKTEHTEFVELYNAGGFAVALGGWKVEGGIGFEFPGTARLEAGAYLVVAEDPLALQNRFGVSALGPFTGRLSNEGDTVRLVDGSGGIVNEVDYGVGFPWPTAAAGEGSSLELIDPRLDNSLGGSWRASGWGDVPATVEEAGFPQPSARGSPPTPGARNSVYSPTAPPQIRQVKQTPEQPRTMQPMRITAKVSDRNWVASVRLAYQIVAPGDYLPANLALVFGRLLEQPETPFPWNSRFADATNWTTVTMVDDGTQGDAKAGDGIYSAVIPPQANRTLIRYRISARDAGEPGASVTVPYPDDPSLNFACFVYDGVPAFQPLRSTVHPEGLGHIYPAEVMNSLPVYFLLTREGDFTECLAYDSGLWIPPENTVARDKFNWEGTFVYDGVVYDHVRYRLRQENDRYSGGYWGKRSMRFRFNKGRYLAAKDNDGRPYPVKWRTLNTGKMVDNLRAGNFGLTESINSRLWNLVGVPAPLTHTFHFRVIEGLEEAPADPEGQFNGDFWGMFLALEDYDGPFLGTHGMPDGNLYKLQPGVFDGNLVKRHQGRFSVTDGSDFENSRLNLAGTQSDEYLRRYVNYDESYRYHAVGQAVRHYDFITDNAFLKNRAWYFEPWPENPLGRLWTLPWDFDVSWGPSYADEGGIDYSLQAIFEGEGKPPFKTEYRNFIREFRDLVWQEEVLEPMIDELAARIAEFSRADRDRWKDAPNGVDFGPLEDKVRDMKDFAFVGWSGTNGPVVSAGGRAAFLDALAAAEGEGDRVPGTPMIVAAGPGDFPVTQLAFQARITTQSANTFGALQWRLAEVTDPAAPVYNPGAPRLLEWNAVWTSGELGRYPNPITIPSAVAAAGHAYRARVRVKNTTGQWSHWSAPLQFVAGPPREITLPDRDGDTLPDAWENAYGLNLDDPRDALADQDGDGETAAEEYSVGTNPRDGADVFRLAIQVAGEELRLSFNARAAEPGLYAGSKRYYALERRTDYDATWIAITSPILGTNQTVVVTESLPETGTQPYYRAKAWLEQ